MASSAAAEEAEKPNPASANITSSSLIDTQERRREDLAG
jgi:hypothetical protein